MAKQASAAAGKPSPLARLREFMREVVAEMKKVAWPSWAELKASTWIVLLLVAIMAVIIYLYDLGFLAAIRALLKLG